MSPPNSPRSASGSLIARIWTFPNTIIGLTIGWLGVCFGGQYRKVAGCYEFHGRLMHSLLKWMPTGTGASAITLGHAILGQTEHDLNVSRAHEHVHVRQYEIWGPLFIPAYLTASLVAWLKGRNAYLGNVFEIEAYTIGGFPCEETGMSDEDSRNPQQQ